MSCKVWLILERLEFSPKGECYSSQNLENAETERATFFSKKRLFSLFGENVPAHEGSTTNVETRLTGIAKSFALHAHSFMSQAASKAGQAASKAG